MIPRPCHRSGSVGTASARRPDHVTGRGVAVRFRSGGTATRPYAKIGWPLFRGARYVEWCGQGQELIPLPDDGEWVRIVPVIGTAR